MTPMNPPVRSLRVRRPRATAVCGGLFFALLLASPPHLSGQIPGASIPNVGKPTPTSATGGLPLPPPAVAEQILQNNPALGEIIRARLQRSGLTAEQIRTRLTAAGYPPNLLDQYLPAAPTAPATAPVPTTETLGALDALGVPEVSVSALAQLPIDTGVVPSPVPAESLMTAASPPGLTLFGANVFRRATTQFQPLLDGPVPSGYHVGPGDALVLVLTGDVEFTYTLEVTRDGFIVIPQVGQLYVNGLTMDDLQRSLRTRLGRAYSGIRAGTTKFNVTIGKVRTIQAFVVGEVTQPGAYQLSALATALNALYAAGGPTDQGNFRAIEIRRGGALEATLDLYDYLLKGDTRGDLSLQQGDVIFVPVQGPRVKLTGAVVRPAIYELKPGQTLADLISAGGGFLPEASVLRVGISRIVPPAQRTAEGPARVFVDVPASQLLDGKAPPFPLEAGDSVSVATITAARRALVELKGAVYHPGTFGWTPGMRLSGLVKLAGGFLPTVYAGRAHIERLNPVDSTRSLLRTTLPATGSGPWPDDPELHDLDVVTIYDREDPRTERTVTIAGMVASPGTFPFRAGMTVRDLVLMAHGLRDGAALDSVEIARLPSDRRDGALATTLRVPIDSTYLSEPAGSTWPRLPGAPGPTAAAPEPVLQPYDQVLIRPQPGFELTRTVTVAGQVRYPGTYALLRRDERVSEVVARAGGLAPMAYPDGARLVRTQDSIGRVDLELPRALKRRGGGADPILVAGDSIVIPEFLGTVRVEGGVNTPTSVQYRKGAGLGYYIANAGGYLKGADKGNVSVRYANGSAKTPSRVLLFFRSSPTPGPGSTISVPVTPLAERTNPRDIIGPIAQILASLAAVFIISSRTK